MSTCFPTKYFVKIPKQSAGKMRERLRRASQIWHRDGQCCPSAYLQVQPSPSGSLRMITKVRGLQPEERLLQISDKRNSKQASTDDKRCISCGRSYGPTRTLTQDLLVQLWNGTGKQFGAKMLKASHPEIHWQALTPRRSKAGKNNP